MKRQLTGLLAGASMLLLSTGILQAAGKDELVYASTKDIRNINPQCLARHNLRDIFLFIFQCLEEVGIKGIFCYISVDIYLLIRIAESNNSTRPLLQIRRSPGHIEVMDGNEPILTVGSCTHFLR